MVAQPSGSVAGPGIGTPRGSANAAIRLSEKGGGVTLGMNKTFVANLSLKY